MRRGALLLAGLSLLVAACSDDAGSTDATTPTNATASSTAPGTDAPPAATDVPSAATGAPPATDAAPQTGAPDATDAPAAATGALIPEAICIDNRSFGTYFGYDNRSDVVVVVPDGPDNRLLGAHEEDEPFRPTVFAPGRVSPAFLAYPSETDPDATVVWEVTGPDGETRSATADGSTPMCDAALLEPTTPDPRTPELRVVAITLNEARDEATVEVELTGVPEVSVCHAAFDAEPATIRIETMDEIAGTTDPFVGTSATFTTPVVVYRNGGPGALVIPHVVVIDRCSSGGTVFGTWPAGTFNDLVNGTRICYSIPESGDPEEWEGGCTDVPATGGIVIRNG